MKKGIKYALFFTGGVAVGIGFCGANLISYALSNEDICDGIKNAISRKLDKALYGERPGRRRYGSSVSYKSYYDERKKSTNTLSYKFDSSNVIFEAREDAENALNKMEEIIYKYAFVTVADLYEIVNIDSDYSDSKYGWVSVKNAKIMRCRSGYYIHLQAPMPIDLVN